MLDLDETLVHCSVEPIVGADLTFSVDFNGVMYTVFVRKRPHLARFLEAIYTKFEVVIFTASQVCVSLCLCLCVCVCVCGNLFLCVDALQKVYADKLLNLLDPELKYFK
ncbi:MAG: NIF family HAD-type phosphatase [Terracidiphilus sp.]|nr:NIF family HAD-type phosphatase [Terracidiphilus sp.]